MKKIFLISLLSTLSFCNINTTNNDIVLKKEKNSLYISSDDFLIKCDKSLSCKEYNFYTRQWEITKFSLFSKDLKTIIKTNI